MTGAPRVRERIPGCGGAPNLPAASTLTAAEVHELRRAAAVGPIDSAVVRRVLEDHDRAQRERSELKATLAQLAPSWRELRSALNELSKAAEGRTE